MDHRSRVQEEFSHQSEHMARSSAFQTADNVQRIVKGLGPPPLGRILDLACGPGILSAAVAPLANEVVGLDITPKMVDLAARRLSRSGHTNAKFKVGVVEDIPFETGSFDGAVTRLSFHHFPDLDTPLAEIRRVLQPHGRLVVADITSSTSAGKAILHNALESLRDPTHVRFLSQREMTDVILDAGFEIINTETWEQQRDFREWAEIVNDPVRTEPLHEVMRALARADVDAGIELREVGGEIHFTHTWVLVAAICPAR
jgi:ubiquinone/menaquinone biosynthesis C-methylase UbiE